MGELRDMFPNGIALSGEMPLDLIGEPLLASFGYGGKFQGVAARYDEWGA